jgi:hypothetical protein
MAGSRWHSLKPILVERVAGLLTKGNTREIAEMIVSAIDYIVYRYVKRIYLKSRDSLYLSKVVQLCTKNAPHIISSNTRKIKNKVSVEEGEGKRKKKVEKLKVSFIKPWVRKDDAWTPKELASTKVVNEALTQNLPEILKQIDSGGPMFNGAVGNKIMAKAWNFVDSFHDIITSRRKTVRQAIISKRAEDKKKDKITPDEWSTQMQIAIEEESKKAVKLNALCEACGFKLEDGIISTSSITSKLENILSAGEAEYFELKIEFDELEKAGPDPQAYHQLVFSEAEGDEEE